MGGHLVMAIWRAVEVLEVALTAGSIRLLVFARDKLVITRTGSEYRFISARQATIGLQKERIREDFCTVADLVGVWNESVSN